MKLSIFNLHRPSPSPEGKPGGDLPRDETNASTANRSSKSVAQPLSFVSGLQQTSWLNRFASQLLKNLLITSSLLGVALYLVNLPGMIRNAQWSTLVVFGLVCVGLLGLTLFSRLSGKGSEAPAKYDLLAAGYLILLFISGFIMLLTDGWYGNGRVLLVILPILAAVLFFGSTNRLFARLARLSVLFLSIASIAIIGLLIGYGQDPQIKPLPDTATLLNWVMMVGGFILITMVCGLSLNAYLNSLEKNLSENLGIAQGFTQEQQRLENQVQQRTNDLERRLVQIRSVAEIIRFINETTSSAGEDHLGNQVRPDIRTLLKRVCEVVKERFGLYYVGVFLVEPTAGGPDYAVLAAGTGEAGQKMLDEGHRLQVGGDSMIGWATANRQARITLDVGRETERSDVVESGAGLTLSNLARFDNPYLPETRSELALPILGFTNQQSVIGALTIQSVVEAAFDQDDILVLQGIADSLAGAIENARLFSQTQADLDEIQALHRQYLQHSWDQFLQTQGSQEYIYNATRLGVNSHQTSDLDYAPKKSLDLPIRLRGQQIGSLNFELEADHALAPEEQAFIDAVINQAALALENARLLDETRQRADQEKVVAGVTSKVWAATNIDTIIRTALKELSTTLDASEGVIELWPEQ